MELKEWRRGRGWSLVEMAEALEITGRSPAETIRRWEAGESRPDADKVARIEEVTGGLVKAADMHATRLSFLRSRECMVIEE